MLFLGNRPVKDERKTKSQLVKELADLRHQIDGLRKGELGLKQAVEALQQSEIRFKELADLLPQTVFEFDDEGKLLFVNRNAFSMFGFSREDFEKGLNAFQTIVPEDRDRAKENIQRALRGEKVGPSEYTLLRKDGSTFPAIVYSSRVAKENRPAGLRGIVIDITDRKWAEGALRESEKRYRMLADNARDLIFTLDMSLRFTYVSPSVRQLLGYTPEEAMDLGVRDVLAPDSAELAFRAFEEEMAMEASGAVDPSRERTMQLKLVAKDQSTVWTEVKMSFLRKPDGRPTEVLGVTRDIRERKRTEAALRESEERLRALFDHAAAGMALMDTNGRVLATNQAHCRFLGYSQEEIVGMHFADFTHPEDLNADEALYESLIEGQRDSYVIDKRYVRKDGEIVWGRLSVSLIRDQEGQAQYSVVVCEDITDRKRAEETIREGEARYRAVMAQSPDGIYLVDVETRQIMEANSAFQKILGYTYSETLGLSFPDFVVGNREDLDRRFMDVLSGKGPFTFERKYRRKDGSLLDVWVSTRVISFGGRKAILVLVRDLTERKRAEAERERIISELQEALSRIKTLRGLIPICANCKKIRDDKGYWQQVDSYVRKHSEAQFSHGLCPECIQILFPDLKGNKSKNGGM
jgi:PAS domain S-box-containing protein